jgi:uncharacterized protein
VRCRSAAIIIAVIVAPDLARAGQYAPIDCGTATSAAERTICGSYALGQDEARMATLFSIATSLVAMGQRGSIQDAQREWLETRKTCGKSIPCLSKVYDARIRELEDIITGIASRGPY